MDLEDALTHFWEQDPIVLGDLNTDIDQYQNPQSQNARLQFHFMKTCLHVQKGRFLRIICDYIMGMDRRRF